MLQGMHQYIIRPYYGGDKLLVEFGSSADDAVLRSDIISALEASGAVLNDVGESRFSELVEFQSPAGTFALEQDEWGLFWIIANRNQNAIEFVGQALQSDQRFTKEIVDFSDYR